VYDKSLLTTKGQDNTSNYHINNQFKTNLNMANQLNSGSLDTLKLDETLLVHIQKSANDSYQALFVEKIDRSIISGTSVTETTDRPVNVLADLNYSDDRFRRGGNNHVYVKATAKDLEAKLQIAGLDIENADFTPIMTKGGKTKQALTLNILNPVNVENGCRFRVVLSEDTTPDTWQANNNDFKVNPSTGEALMKDGKHIYSHHYITYAKGDGYKDYHTLVQHDRVNVAVEQSLAEATQEMSMM